MNYALYIPATGEIVLTGCVPDDREPAVPPGHALYQGATDTGHYIDAAGQPRPKGPAPSAQHVFDHARKAWVDPRSALQVLQAARRADYPHIGEQLDAIWKELARSGAQSPEGADMLARILAVKARHPKP